MFFQILMDLLAFIWLIFFAFIWNSLANFFSFIIFTLLISLSNLWFVNKTFRQLVIWKKIQAIRKLSWWILLLICWNVWGVIWIKIIIIIILKSWWLVHWWNYRHWRKPWWLHHVWISRGIIHLWMVKRFLHLLLPTCMYHKWLSRHHWWISRWLIMW